MEPSDNHLDCPTDIERIANKNNLEYFPLEVLLKNFARTDDIGLLNLAKISNRFASIAPIVFGNRYANKYFVLNGESKGGDPELYDALLDRFGVLVKAFEVNHVEGIDDDHWLAKILQQHTHHIEKLTFTSCFFTSNNILVRAVNLTDLVFRNVKFYYPTNLPDSRNLTKLEIRYTQYISNNSLKQTIRNNPDIQSLLIDHFIGFYENYQHYGESIIPLIANHLPHIKSFTLMEFPSPINIASTIHQGFGGFTDLESLDLSMPGSATLLQHLGTNCKKTKHLGLHKIGRREFEAVHLFQQIESLHLSLRMFNDVWLDQVIQHLPNLRHLYLGIHEAREDFIYKDILPLLRSCPSLDRMVCIVHSNEPHRNSAYQ